MAIPTAAVGKLVLSNFTHSPPYPEADSKSHWRNWKYKEKPTTTSTQSTTIAAGDVSSRVCVCVTKWYLYCLVANFLQKQLLVYKSYALQLSYLKNPTILVNFGNCSTIHTIQF